MQAIYELVGERVREIFDAQVDRSSRLYDEATELIHFPYDIEDGEPLPDDRGGHVGTGPDVDGHPTPTPDRHRASEPRRSPSVAIQDGGAEPQSGSACPITGRRPSRSASICPREPRAATPSTSADVAFFSTLAVEPGRRARERPPVRRDQAPPDRDRRTGRRAGRHQRGPVRARRAARLRRDHRAGGRTRSARSSRPRSIYIAVLDEATNGSRFRSTFARANRSTTEPYAVGAGSPRPGRPRPASRSASRARTSTPPGGHRTAASGHQSWLGVPILAGDRIFGVISLECPSMAHSATASSGSCRRWRRAWASPSRTRGCSMRPSAS